MRIKEIDDNSEKKYICNCILEQLPDYFGIESARKEYASNTVDQKMYVAECEQNQILGFVSLKATSEDCLEIAVIGVLSSYHGKGIGSKLITTSIRHACKNGYKYLQVKTVAEGYYQQYDLTNKFYQKTGFSKLEIIDNLWGPKYPCQIYIQVTKNHNE